jgi:replicative DNA helicase
MTPTPAADRVLPHDIEAERSVLGSVLIHNSVVDHAAEVLTGAMFYRDAHRRIWKSMTALADARQGIDPITLTTELARTGDLKDVGGPAYLASLVDGLPHSANVPYYAGIVREKFLLRQLIHAGSQLVAHAYDGARTSTEILIEADRALLDAQFHGEAGGLVEMKERASELFDDLEALVANKGQLLGLDTGFPSINDQTQGWQSGDLIIIAARPSIGKTAFVVNSAIVPARQGKHVAIFSLEMRRRQLERRMLSFLSGVPLSKIQTGYLTDSDYKGLATALGILAELPLYINDRSGLTVSNIRLACRRQRHEHGLDLVVVDYVQLIRGSLDRRAATRNEELGDISQRLKWLADELSVPVIVLSQLKRIGHSRPSLDDLRDSGSLEQDADLVCFLHRKNHKESGITNFILEKQRNGPTGTVNLSLDRDIQLFTDAGQQTDAQATAATADEEQDAKTRAIIRQRAKRR